MVLTHNNSAQGTELHLKSIQRLLDYVTMSLSTNHKPVKLQAPDIQFYILLPASELSKSFNFVTSVVLTAVLIRIQSFGIRLLVEWYILEQLTSSIFRASCSRGPKSSNSILTRISCTLYIHIKNRPGHF